MKLRKGVGLTYAKKCKPTNLLTLVGFFTLTRSRALDSAFAFGYIRRRPSIGVEFYGQLSFSPFFQRLRPGLPVLLQILPLFLQIFPVLLLVFLQILESLF